MHLKGIIKFLKNRYC